MKAKEVWLAFVNDNVLTGNNVGMTMEQLRNELALDEEEHLDVGASVRYVGGTYKRVDENTIEYSIAEYVQAQDIKGNFKNTIRFLKDHWASEAPSDVSPSPAPNLSAEPKSSMESLVGLPAMTSPLPCTIPCLLASPTRPPPSSLTPSLAS